MVTNEPTREPTFFSVQLKDTTSMSMWLSMVIILRWAADITDWSDITCQVVCMQYVCMEIDV